MRPNLQETADLVTFTEEILNGKLQFLCSVFQHITWRFEEIGKIFLLWQEFNWIHYLHESNYVQCIKSTTLFTCAPESLSGGLLGSHWFHFKIQFNCILFY